MKPNEKSKELVNRFSPLVFTSEWDDEDEEAVRRLKGAKECALICVDEIINSYESLNKENGTEWNHDNLTFHFLEYWNEVKEEINKL